MTLQSIRKHNIMRNDFGFIENPYSGPDYYNVDNPGSYDPLMYGKQYEEFYTKFFLNPLSRETDRQLIGAVWSTYAANRLGKGYGKSMLMGEESKAINRDFGASKLREFRVPEKEIAANPFVSGYCSFKESNEVKSFPAALLDAVAFILRSEHGNSETVHQALRRRICNAIKTEEGYEGESIRQALEQATRRYRSLAVQLTHREVRAFNELSCSDDTDALISRMAEIGPRIRATQGFNFVHIFNVFLQLARISYVCYFVDQIENFAKYARRQDQNIRILRESICETSPTREMASFIFQMHIQAQQVIEDWWENIEHLPSLDAKKRINGMRIVDLQGLTSRKEAIQLAEKYHADKRVPRKKVPHALYPFNKDIIEEVRRHEGGNPRQFRQKLEAILEHAVNDGRSKIDLAYVQPFLEEIPEAIGAAEEEEEYSNVER